jgi:hypothetical protein
MRCDAVVVSRAKRVGSCQCHVHAMPWQASLVPPPHTDTARQLAGARLADRSIGRCSRGPLDNESAERCASGSTTVCFHTVPTLIFMPPSLGHSRHVLYGSESALVVWSSCLAPHRDVFYCCRHLQRFPLYLFFFFSFAKLIEWCWQRPGSNRIPQISFCSPTDRIPNSQYPTTKHCAPRHF